MTTPTDTTPPLDPAQVALAKLQELAKECDLPPDRMLAVLVLAALDDNVTDGVFRCAMGLSCWDPLPWKDSENGEARRWAYNTVVAMQLEWEPGGAKNPEGK